MKLIEKILKEKWMKTELAKYMQVTVSNINMLLKNNTFTVSTKIRWTEAVNDLLDTKYKWNDLFSETKEND